MRWSVVENKPVLMQNLIHLFPKCQQASSSPSLRLLKMFNEVVILKARHNHVNNKRAFKGFHSNPFFIQTPFYCEFAVITLLFHGKHAGNHSESL